MQAFAVLQHFSNTSATRPLRRGTGASAHGSALISALVFTLIIALALAGMGTLTVSHYNLAHVQAASSESLDLAEAGINWELHKLTTKGVGSADDGTITYKASEQIDKISNSLPGTFTVSCATPDGSKLTSDTKQFSVTCTALIQTSTGPAKRIVRINARPFVTYYTLYSNTGTNFNDNGIVVSGISGSNGTQTIKAGLTTQPKIDQMVFNGNKAPTDSTYKDYKMVSNPSSLNLKKTTDFVNAAFPNGGENYLRTHNDNDMAARQDPTNPGVPPQPAITTDPKGGYNLNASGHDLITLKGKPGGANYYLTDLNMIDQSNLVFDNTDGPINIYQLHSSAAGILMRGGHALKSLQEAPDNKVRMFLNVTGGVRIDAADPIPGVTNSTEVDMGIYNYDTYTVKVKGKTYILSSGNTILGNNVNFVGQIVSDVIDVSANANFVGKKGYFETPIEYYGFDGTWTELNNAGGVGVSKQ